MLLCLGAHIYTATRWTFMKIKGKITKHCDFSSVLQFIHSESCCFMLTLRLGAFSTTFMLSLPTDIWKPHTQAFRWAHKYNAKGIKHWSYDRQTLSLKRQKHVRSTHSLTSSCTRSSQHTFIVSVKTEAVGARPAVSHVCCRTGL